MGGGLGGDGSQVTGNEEFWKRVEQKAKNLLTTNVTFDLELQRVEKLFHRNESAFANLVSVRENLLGIYVKEGIQRDFPNPMLNVVHSVQKERTHKKKLKVP